MSTTINFEHEAQAKEETYSIGQLFVRSEELYVLAVIDKGLVALICINDGCRWWEGVRVERTSEITEIEMNKVMGKDKFILVSVEITTKPYKG